MVLQIAFDFENILRIELAQERVLSPSAETLFELVMAAIGNHADHSRGCKATDGIELDGGPGSRIPGNTPGRLPGRNGDGDHGFTKVRIHQAPFQDLHSTKRTTDHTTQAPDTERVEQFFLNAHHIANSDDRE